MDQPLLVELVDQIRKDDRPNYIVVRRLPQPYDHGVLPRRDINELIAFAMGKKVIRSIPVVKAPPAVFVITADLRPEGLHSPIAQVRVQGLGGF